MSSDKKIKIGIMGGRCDCDLLHAPGIPEKPEAAGLRMNEENSVWVREGAGKKKDEMVHSDVAIWWCVAKASQIGWQCQTRHGEPRLQIVNFTSSPGI